MTTAGGPGLQADAGEVHPRRLRRAHQSNAVLFQWHTQQGGPSPLLPIRVGKGDWLLTATATATEKRRTLVKIPFEKDRWTDWVVHARWSADKKGFWTLWKDGVEVASERDVITQYPEALGPYAKFGQYHSVGEVPQNVVYFGEYQVAGPKGTMKRWHRAGRVRERSNTNRYQKRLYLCPASSRIERRKRYTLSLGLTITHKLASR